jgi:hypothetical protein
MSQEQYIFKEQHNLRVSFIDRIIDQNRHRERWYNVYDLLHTYNPSNISKFKESRIFKDQHCQIDMQLHGTSTSKIWLNDRAFVTYIMQCSSNILEAQSLRDWYFANSRLLVSVTDNFHSVLESDIVYMTSTQLWRQILGKEHKKQNEKKRREWLRYGCMIFSIPFVRSSIYILLRYVCMAKNIHLSNHNNRYDSLNGKQLLEHLLSSNDKLLMQIKNKVLYTYERAMRKQNVPLFALAKPTKEIWETIRDILQRDTLGTIAPIFSLHLPQLLYSFDYLKTLIDRIIAQYWVYSPLQFMDSTTIMFGISINDNGLVHLLQQYWSHNNSHFFKAMSYQESLVPFNNRYQNNRVCLISITRITRTANSPEMSEHIPVLQWSNLLVFHQAIIWYQQQYFSDRNSQHFCNFEQYDQQTKTIVIFQVCFERIHADDPLFMNHAYQLLMRTIPILHLIIGGDNFRKALFNSPLRRKASQVTLKIANLRLDLFSKISNHIILAILEGKESYEQLQTLYSRIFPQLKVLELDGITLERTYYHCKISLCGDMEWLWLLLGMRKKSFSGKICWLCEYNNLTDHWYEDKSERKIEDLIREQGVSHSNVIHEPVFLGFPTTAYKPDIHHSQLAHVRALCRILIQRAHGIQSDGGDSIDVTLHRVNTLFEQVGISLVLTPDVKKIPETIGSMFNDIYDLSDQLGEIVHFTDTDKLVLCLIQRALNIGNNQGSSMDGTPTIEEIQWFIDNITELEKLFERQFNIRYDHE